MANENAVLYQTNQIAPLYEQEVLNDEASSKPLDFARLEEELQGQLDQELAGLEFLEAEKEKIGNPDNLGKVIQDVVWEQFMNQVAGVAGADFIEENRGLPLDLRDKAHIQTAENFAQGKIAIHNTKIDYQKRYYEWQEKFAKDASGKVVTHPTRTGREEATLAPGARKPFDEGRPGGSREKGTDMDHIISTGKIIRDPAANAHLSQEERIKFANSDVNLNEMPAKLNRSKGDKTVPDWLDNPNAKGQKPRDIFPEELTPEKEAELREKDAAARKEYEKLKKKGVERSLAAGRQSQKEEAFRLGGTALRAAVMALVANLAREIIAKLVKWFKTAERTMSSLLASLKEAVHSFVNKLKTHILNAGNTVLTTVVTTIFGPIVNTLKKVWLLLKQGWKALKNAVKYLRDPANREQPLSVRLMRAGEIIIAGLTATGALILSDVIEKGLIAFSPVFALQIPLLGSLANILGLFFGAVVAGIVGAIAINFIESLVANRMKREIVMAEIEKGNEVLQLQDKLYMVKRKRLDEEKGTIATTIYQRHEDAATIMKSSLETIMVNEQRLACMNDGAADIEEKISENSVALDELLGEA